MTAQHSAGPAIVWGALASGTGGSNPDAGPSAHYQGTALLDPRTPYAPGLTGLGKVSGLLHSPRVAVLDSVPSALGAALIAAAQTATSGAALTLSSTASAAITPNTPIVPFGAPLTAANVVNVLGLDVGFATANTTAGSATLASVSNTAGIVPGLKVLVAGGTVGAMVGATVISVSGSSVTLDTAMGATRTGAVVALANGTGQAGVAPVAVVANRTAGHLSVIDAASGVSRGVSVTSNNVADTGWSVLVQGYDLYGVAMSETIAVSANATAYGWKAFGFIASVTPSKGGGGSTTGTLSVGTSDVIGLDLRCDRFEYLDACWAGAPLLTSAGFTAADATSPATTTTHDVRGTIQLSAAGPLGSFATGGATDGAKRVVVFLTLPQAAVLSATPANPAPLFGVTQA